MTGGLKDLRMMLSTESDVIERKSAAGVDSGMGETDWSAIYEISRREWQPCASSSALAPSPHLRVRSR